MKYATFNSPLRLCVAALTLWMANPPLNAGRYEEMRSHLANGPHLELIAATFLGADRNEELRDAAQLADGRILAVGFEEPSGSRRLT